MRPNRFAKSEQRFWWCFAAGIGLCVVSMALYGSEAIQVVVITVGGIFGLATGQTVITNYAESRNPSYYFDDLPQQEPYIPPGRGHSGGGY